MSLVLVLARWKSNQWRDWWPHTHTPWREWQPWRGSHCEPPHSPASWSLAAAGFHGNCPESQSLLPCHHNSQSLGTARKNTHTHTLLCVLPCIFVPLSVCAVPPACVSPPPSSGWWRSSWRTHLDLWGRPVLQGRPQPRSPSLPGWPSACWPDWEPRTPASGWRQKHVAIISRPNSQFRSII